MEGLEWAVGSGQLVVGSGQLAVGSFKNQETKSKKLDSVTLKKSNTAQKP